MVYIFIIPMAGGRDASVGLNVPLNLWTVASLGTADPV